MSGAAGVQKKLRVMILNAVTLNAGDAAILYGLMSAVEEAAGAPVEFLISEGSPVVARRLHPNISFFHRFGEGGARSPRLLRSLIKRIRRLRMAAGLRIMGLAPGLGRWLLPPSQQEWMDLVRTCDVAISTGGTYFTGHYPLTGKVLEVLAAHRCGIPVYLYTQSLGPFTRRTAKRQMRQVVEACAGIYLRDEASREALLAIGAPAQRLHVCADAAFTLVRSPVADGLRSPRLRIAISVRTWRHFQGLSAAVGSQRYVDALRSVIHKLVADGHEITFLSTCQGVPEYDYDDAQMARDIVMGLGVDAARVTVDDAFRQPQAIIAAYESFDLLIATRMHAAIMGMIAGTPVVGIAYETKTTHLFAKLGMSELTTPIEALDGDHLYRQVSDALARRLELQTRLRHHLPALREEALIPARDIIGALRPGR